VDYGFDLLTDAGVRIQVKSSHLYMNHPAYPAGAYRFSVRENLDVRAGKQVRRRPRRNWNSLCDFFVFWGIEENRFFVVPCSSMAQGTVYVRRRIVAREEMCLRAVHMRDQQGFKTGRIAEELGVSMRETRWLLSPSPKSQKFGEFENRWDLLDVNSATERILQTAAVSASVEIQKQKEL
jgi:hypothetical protein